MLSKTFAILCLLNKVVFAKDVLPALDGKYFYSDFRASTGYGVKFVDAQIGKGDGIKRKMDLFVTTSQQEAAIITTDCPNPQVCDIPAGYNARNVNKLTNT